MLDKRKFYIDGKWVSPSKPNNFDIIKPSRLNAPKALVLRPQFSRSICDYSFSYFSSTIKMSHI